MGASVHQLFVALYVRDDVLNYEIPEKEDLYHWAFLLIPDKITDTTQALRLHARNYHSGPDSATWYFEEVRVPAKATPKLLTKISVGNVVDIDHMLEIIRDVPIHQDNSDWNCVTWIHEALDELALDNTVLEGEGSGSDWLDLRDRAIGAAELILPARLLALAAVT